MRDIKFQVLWVRNNSDFTKSIETHYTTLDRLTNGKDNFPYSEVEVVAKRQQTGLKDKNGVEIYEGDIVKETYSCGNHSKNVAVKLDSKWCGFAPFCYFSSRDSAFEVIGNIHQNPELLEGE